MLGTSKNAAAWLWDRWVLLSLMVLGISIVSTAVLRLPQVPGASSCLSAPAH